VLDNLDTVVPIKENDYKISKQLRKVPLERILEEIRINGNVTDVLGVYKTKLL
jgi:hypothetical protein